MPTNSRRFAYLLIAALLLLAACQPAPANAIPTPTTAANQPQPAATTAPAIPTQPSATDQALPLDPAAAYPTPGGDSGLPAYPGATEAPVTPQSGEGYPEPAAVPAADNQASVTARLIEQAPGDSAGETRLHVQILAVEAINGQPNQAAKLGSGEADLFAQTANLPDLRPGDQFTAVVSLVGDEQGGKYTAQQIQKIQQ